MKKLSILAFMMLFLASFTNATIRRLQYWGLPIVGVDYANGDAAVAASAAGDTILVFHSTSSSFTINKQLVIIGTGNWNWAGADANFNPNLQNIQPASGGYIQVTFAPGSNGTIVTGCRLTFTVSGSTAVDNIKISNCTNWAVGNWTFGTGGSNLTYDNWEFSKCYLAYGIVANNNTIKFTNLKIFNCISDGTGGYAVVNLGTALGQTGIIENCSLTSTGGNFNLTFNGFLIQNCIFHNCNPSNYSNSVFNNNVFYNTPSPAITGANNIFNATAANLFIGIPTLGTNSFDGKWMLKPGSPAIGAGIAGIDCGAYGGVNPYKLSLIPAIPAFYKLTAPGSAATTNPYQITFSVRANN